MGHTCAKDIYIQLGESLDSLVTRTPVNKAFLNILTGLYTQEEAELIVKMPTGLTPLAQLAKCTGIDRNRLELLLDDACAKGLVVDFWLHDIYYYAPAPFVIGLFEFTMMRTGEGCDCRKWSSLFNDYMMGSDEFFQANCGDGQPMQLMRTMPHEEAVEKLKEALKITPDRAELWASWGVALVEQEQFEEAAEKFQKAVELQSDFVPALYGWGIALKAQGKEEEAIEKFQKAAEIDTATQD